MIDHIPAAKDNGDAYQNGNKKRHGSSPVLSELAELAHQRAMTNGFLIPTTKMSIPAGTGTSTVAEC
jgi:hypothetical protein